MPFLIHVHRREHERFTQAVSRATPGSELDGEELADLVAKVGAAHDIPVVGPPLGMPHGA